MTIKETDQTTWTPEPEPDTEPESDPVSYPAPQPEPTPMAEFEVASELDDDLETRTEGYDESETDVRTDDEPDTDLAPETTATADESETLDRPDEVDLGDAPAAATTEGQPFLGDTGIYEERWTAIKASFVDEPRQAVQSADRLVTEAMEDRARVLMSHRDALQAQWCQDDDVDTERLRVVFQDYRAFLVGPLST